MAQLPSGTISPDFTATDLNGVEHNLYSYLDSGYQVIVDFKVRRGAALAGTTTQGGVLEELYNAHGPNGTNELRVFFIEGDDNTTQADLEGTQAPPRAIGSPDVLPHHRQWREHFRRFECTYYPTIYTICPNKILTRLGKPPLDMRPS